MLIYRLVENTLRRPFQGRTRSRLAALSAVAISGAALALAPAAHAATATTYTVATVNAGVGAGCTGAAPTFTCETLTDALSAANVQTGAAGDSILVKFAASLQGVLVAHGDASTAMTADPIGSAALDHIGFQGAQYLIKQAHNLPVTLDFDGQVGLMEKDVPRTAAVWIASPDVTVTGATHLVGAEASIAISAARATVKNSTIDGANMDMACAGESGIALINGADNATVTNVHFLQPCVYGVYVAPRYNDGTGVVPNVVRNLALNNVLFDLGTPAVPSTGMNSEVFVGVGGHVDGLTIKNSQFLSPVTGGHIQVSADVTNTDPTIKNAVLDNNTFKGGSWAIDFQGVSDTIAVTSSTFTGMLDGVVDQGGSKFTNLTIKGNTFEGNRDHDIWFDESTTSNVLIDSNKFLNETNSGISQTTIWWNGAGTGTGNVISNNLFQFVPGQFPAPANNRWAIWAGGGSSFHAGNGVKTGLSILSNRIDGYGLTGSQASIALDGTGAVDIQRNTFINVPGTTDAAKSEATPFYFVDNHGQINNRIQTWRPTAATFSGNKVSVTVAPVNPAQNGLVNQPIGNVTVDVFWTATDQAEVYLGSFTNISAASTKVFTNTHGAGFIRVQTTDSAGQSSQYSGTTKLAAATAPAAPVVKALAPTGNISGTGVPGNTIKVFNAAGKVVATTIVQSDGTWVATVKPLKCGESYTASQYNALGQASGKSTVLNAPACASETGTGTGTGSGAANNGGDTSSPNLPETGAPAHQLPYALGAVLLVGAGLEIMRRSRRQIS